MKQAFLFFVFLFSSNFLFADVGGSWIGWLYWSYDNSPTRCDATMVTTQTPTSFQRLSGNLQCDMVRMDMDPKSWTLDNGNILEENKVVGSYTGDHFQWSENYSPTVMIKAEIKVEARHMDYREKWYRKSDNAEIYYIKGRLFLRD